MRRLLAIALLIAAFLVVSCSNQGTGKSGVVLPKIPSPMAPPKPAYTDISMRCQGQRTCVIMFHDVIEKRGKGSVWFDCTRSEFEAIMAQIKQQGATPISLDQLYRHLTEGEKIPDESIVLTFDDNYQGFHDVAWPILKANNYPATMFVHTAYVGDKKGSHPKMDWATLQELLKDPLFSVGSHTITHPADITTLTPDQIKKELEGSKATLEQHLGIKVPFIAYPDGKNDATVQQLARQAGYLMAFTMKNGPAEESPNILCVNRYIQTKVAKAFDDCDRSRRGGALSIFQGPIKDAPVTYQEGEFAGCKLGLITGGLPISLMSPGREGVLDFLKRTPGAVAGINGGFFAMAAINSTDNQMVGPLKTGEMPQVQGDESPERWDKLRNRPLIMWGPSGMAILAYQPETMRTDAAFRDFMPDVTDTFMAGAWLVHGGVAQSRADLDTFASTDVNDPRRRAFMGIMNSGEIVLGATLESASSDKMADAAAAAGVQEAVLLDSGFSTSLVYGESIKASGHSELNMPSRPVPHAILLKGTLDPATAALGAADATPPPQTDDERKPRRRHRRR